MNAVARTATITRIPRLAELISQDRDKTGDPSSAFRCVLPLSTFLRGKMYMSDITLWRVS